MRVAPLLFVVLVIAGCGRASQESIAMRSVDSAQVVSAAPFAETKAFMGGAAAAARMRSQMAAGEAPAKAEVASMERPIVQRLVVRNADLALQVKSVERTETEVGQAARSVGGIVEASQGTDLAGPTPGMTMTLRVPEPRFDEALRLLEKLGKRTGKTISSDDVTSQAVDLEARIKSLRVQEDAYRAILGAARRIPDVLEIQEKLTGVRTEIEQLVAQRRDLGDQAARSKIVVTLAQDPKPFVAPPPAPEPDWLGATWTDATGTLRAFGRGLASLGIWTLTMLPIWLPVVLVGVFLVRRGASVKA